MQMDEYLKCFGLFSLIPLASVKDKANQIATNSFGSSVECWGKWWQLSY